MQLIDGDTDASILREDGSYLFHYPPKFAWLGNAVGRHHWTTATAYLHVPFCRKICTFCTFERKRIRRGALDEFVTALWREMDITRTYEDFSGAQLRAAYVGGGTGSLMGNQDLIRFVGRLRDEFGLLDDAEVTLECEPGTKSREEFAELRNGGFNRISIGAQAFQDDILKALNRGHTSDGTLRAIENARVAGFTNVHIDLMYGLPGQTIDMWNATLDVALSLGLTHISTYQMIVFENERLDRVAEELDRLPAADDIREMRSIAESRLPRAGLEQYSLTEFAQPGRGCEYVRSNWDGSDYVGFGPGAYSRHGHDLWENHVYHSRYYAAIGNSERPVGRSHVLTAREQVLRDVAMGLCMLEVDLAAISEYAGADAWRMVEAPIRILAGKGLVELQGDALRLTPEGRRYATGVMKFIAN